MNPYPPTTTPLTPNHNIILRMRNAERRVEKLQAELEELKSKHKPLEKFVSLVNPSGHDAGAALVRKLSPREMSVIALLVNGRSNKEIGLQLNHGEQYVKNLLRTVYLKAGCDSRLSLCRMVMGSSALLAETKKHQQ